MVHVEFLVEEPSTEVTLEMLISKVWPSSISFKIHVFQGKRDLLHKLGQRLLGYSNYIQQDWVIVVLVDEDRQNCEELKEKMETKAREAGLRTRTQNKNRYQVVNRIAVEELEAWFFGDPSAIRRAYPKVDSNFEKKAKYRDSDAIRGGTAEQLERMLNDAGYHSGGLQKQRAALEIADHMTPSENQSPSFHVFLETLIEIKNWSID